MESRGDDHRDAGFGLYVHWPFCEAKCPYCDFNSHVASRVDHAAWRGALLRDLRRQARGTQGRRLGSIFFGGGTPSLMDPDTVGAVVAEARRIWPAAADLEVTLEANPTSVEAGRFRAFRDAGVDRVSMGVQSLRDADLRALGRTHDVAQARAAFDTARACFDRVSFDLIYARPHQTVAAWKAELREALSMTIDHLSLYQLTIEPGTVFARRARVGRLPGLPDPDAGADFYDATQDVTGAAGLPAYEVSNHACAGAACRHNMTYWRAGDWLGVGPGAHGRYGTGGVRRAAVGASDPGEWLSRVAARGMGSDFASAPAPLDHAEEYLLTALRLAEGLDRRRLRHLGLTVANDHLVPLIDEGLVHPDADTAVRPTRRGMAVADALTDYLAARASPARDSVSHN